MGPRANVDGRPAHRMRQGELSALRGASVLLAEDDMEMRRLLASALRKDGYEVIEAKDGTELLDYLATAMLHGDRFGWPEVIITDVRMPGATGLQVLAGLRQSDWETPIVLITAFGDEAVHTAAGQLGAALLDKPFDVDDLRQIVRRLTSTGEAA